MDNEKIRRLTEELAAIDKWDRFPGESTDPVGKEARQRRRWEIIRELDSTLLRLHRIGILMCAAGRFLVCSTCHLSFEFPAGVHYHAIEKQFESHPCVTT